MREINRKISKLENFRKCQKCIATIGHHPSEMNRRTFSKEYNKQHILLYVLFLLSL